MGSFSEASGFGFGFGLAAGTDGPQNGDNALGAFRTNFAVRGKKPFMRWRFLSDGLWKGGFSW